MSQINVNPGGSVAPNDRGDSAVAAGINLVTVLIVLVVAIVVIAALYWLFMHSGLFGSGIAPAPSVPVHPAPAIAPK